MKACFDSKCTACKRLSGFLKEVRRRYPDYYARPVPAFGDDNPRLLIVGLAPGMHGANRTGRPFTGDYAGILLYETLFKTGLASKPESLDANDGLVLQNCRITNAVKCLPPENKPTTEEIRCCNRFLKAELDALEDNTVVLALGTIAHNAVLRAMELKLSSCKFAHGSVHPLARGIQMIDSYHCSRYNTQTRRLTPAQFEEIFRQVKTMLD